MNSWPIFCNILFFLLHTILSLILQQIIRKIWKLKTRPKKSQPYSGKDTSFSYLVFSFNDAKIQKRFKTDTTFKEKTHFPIVALSLVYTKNTEKVKKIWNFKKMFLSLQRERRSQVEPRCAERWHGCGNTEMMSNSTLPLGFLHSNIELVTCGQLLYFLILRQRKLCRVLHFSCCNEIYFFHKFTTYLHLIIRMNNELRLPISIDEALTIVVEIHLKTILRETYQVGISNHKSFSVL